MPYLLARESITISIPAAQSIRVGNPRGVKAQLLCAVAGRPNAPVIDIPAAAGTTFGPYAVATDVTLVNNSYEPVEYVVAVTPVLTDAPYNPAAVAITGGTVNATPVGNTTRSTGAFTTIASTATDSTGAPGNVINNSANGRAAFAAAGVSVVVTNSSVAVTDTVLVTLLGAADATLTNIVGVTVAAGSFTVTGNAAATATKRFMFTVIKS